jgi:hypothetical protein
MVGAVRFSRHIGALPPAAAQRLEQRGGVGETSCLGLHQRHPCLLRRAIRVQQRQIADAARLVLRGSQRQAVGCGLLRRRLFAQRIGVELQRAQRVGDVLERLDHGAAVLRRRLLQRGRRRALLVQQRAGVE